MRGKVQRTSLVTVDEDTAGGRYSTRSGKTLHDWIDCRNAFALNDFAGVVFLWYRHFR